MAKRDPFTLDLFADTALATSPLLASLSAPPSPDLASPPITPPSLETPIPDEAAPPPVAKGENFHLAGGTRRLAKAWRDRARDNLAAIILAAHIEAQRRPATLAEQAELVKFIGFGATELANTVFRRPGETTFHKGWEELGAEIEAAVDSSEYASLARCTQYAHFTPEFIVRALWDGVERLGFKGGRVLEPGLGVGLFPALIPPTSRATTRFTGVEIDAVTARVARLLQPQARVIHDDFTQVTLKPGYDLAIGNPPFSNRAIKSDPAYRALAPRLHDYFIAKAIDLLRPGALAAFVTSTGTLDKAESAVRERIAETADLVAAIRLPKGSFKADAGADVCVDLLYFRKRRPEEPAGSREWTQLAEVVAATPTVPAIHVNAYFGANPSAVLGAHALARSPYGPGLAYVCLPHPGVDLPTALTAAILRLPKGVCDLVPEPGAHTDVDDAPLPGEITMPEGRVAREGSYFLDDHGRLMQTVEGRAQRIHVRKGHSSEGIFEKHARIISKLVPTRDAVREILADQEADRPWQAAQARLAAAWRSFVRDFGPINTTVVSTSTDEDGETHEVHRHPNLAPFSDDPDCWLVASIENYDLDTDTAKPGPIFTDRVIAPPPTAQINSTADALAVALNELGRVDIARITALRSSTEAAVIAELGDAIWLDPADSVWKTKDDYLSGPVRAKLTTARDAAAKDPAFQRNVFALEAVQPTDLPPSEITAKLGAAWIPTEDIEAFVREVINTPHVTIHHTPKLAKWTVNANLLKYTAEGTSEWGTRRRDAAELLGDSLNASIPQIYDTFRDADGKEHRDLNTVETEAAKDKLAKIKAAFQDWIWKDDDRAERLARLYNEKYNDIAPRFFDGSHLTLPGASCAFNLYAHQKRATWRIISTGSTYVAHCVGSGKTLVLAASIMEERRLGLINKGMLVVPSHCLANQAREFLTLYPNARILVADDTNFSKDKRRRFLSRAATANWDAIIITHSAFKLIPAPEGFERKMIKQALEEYEDFIATIDKNDRISRKCAERMKESFADKLDTLKARKDDLLTISEIGIDQILVDEGQEFRKLSFTTNTSNMKGVDPNGSQRAWDLFVKTRWIETKNPHRALVFASGTPITNTLGELYTLQRFLGQKHLDDHNLGEFDAWASTFGETTTELELQPSGKYKPVTRFAHFVNLPELIAMFRSFADVVTPGDLAQTVKVPTIAGGRRQIVTAPQTDAFKAYQATLAARIADIEQRSGPPQKGDDILLSVIGDGRHAAIDLRLVDYPVSEPDNKLNTMIGNIFRIWRNTAADVYVSRDGKRYDRRGAGQLVFSDLGTLSVESKRGFSAYRWIRDELVRMGVPSTEIAFMQDFKKIAEKRRLFREFDAGKFRILIGSTQTMGTGVNVQFRLKALHHLDVPWLPSDIEQREGRIVRQGNSHDEVELYAYATLGSLDATMWQLNERKARFIAAALSGDTSIRRLDDIGEGQANQFAIAKAIASGDPRLMQKAGLETEIARLERQRSAHWDDQISVKSQIRGCNEEIARATRKVAALKDDIARRTDTRGENFAMTVGGQTYYERKPAGQALMSAVSAALSRSIDKTVTIGSIGGFDICFEGLRSHLLFQFHILLMLSVGEYEMNIDAKTTPLGAVSGLEYALANLEAELRSQEFYLADAKHNLEGFIARQGRSFEYEADLTAKKAELAAINDSLANEGNKKTGSADNSNGAGHVANDDASDSEDFHAEKIAA